MKAILNYGQFSTMINISEVRDTISIHKPIEINWLPLEEFNKIDTETKYILEFGLKDRLNDDIWLYEFVGEK